MATTCTPASDTHAWIMRLVYLRAVDGEAGGRAAGEENARKFRQEQHVLRVVLQLLPREAGLSAGGLARPVPSSRGHLFHRKPVVGRGGCSGRTAQRVLRTRTIVCGYLFFFFQFEPSWVSFRSGMGVRRRRVCDACVVPSLRCVWCVASTRGEVRSCFDFF